YEQSPKLTSSGISCLIRILVNAAENLQANVRSFLDFGLWLANFRGGLGRSANVEISSANIAKCDRSVCGTSFTYRVNNRGELRLPCGRPASDWSRRGERFINSHSGMDGWRESYEWT
ncbi:hypothetical protein TNCV_4633801, partial [Trichonephila clavipes]